MGYRRNSLSVGFVGNGGDTPKCQIRAFHSYVVNLVEEAKKIELPKEKLMDMVRECYRECEGGEDNGLNLRLRSNLCKAVFCFLSLIGLFHLQLANQTQ